MGSKYLLFCISFLSIVACTEDKDNMPQERYKDTSTAIVNGDTLDFDPYFKYFPDSNYFGIQLSHYNNNDILRKTIYFGFIKYKFKKQFAVQTEVNNKKNVQTSFSTRISDGDVVGNYYIVNKSDTIEDFIKITELDMNKNIVVGKYEGSYYVDTSTVFDPSAPDTIIVRGGSFNTTILE